MMSAHQMSYTTRDTISFFSKSIVDQLYCHECFICMTSTNIPTDGPMIIFLSVSFVMKRQLPATNFQISSKNWSMRQKRTAPHCSSRNYERSFKENTSPLSASTPSWQSSFPHRTYCFCTSS